MTLDKFRQWWKRAHQKATGDDPTEAAGKGADKGGDKGGEEGVDKGGEEGADKGADKVADKPPAEGNAEWFDRRKVRGGLE